MKLPTLLEGEALATWLSLDEEDQKNYDEDKAKLIKILSPTEFLTLDQFHRRKLAPGELLSVFIHDLKKLIQHAMPTIPHEVRDQMLLHQLLAGLPTVVDKQLRATGETKDLNEIIQ